MKPSIRLWPGVAAVVVQWLGLLLVPIVAPDIWMYGMFAAVAMGLVVAVWWLLFSRIPWIERIAALVLIPVLVIATKRVVDVSVENGLQSMMVPIFSIPFLSVALVVWAAAARRLARPARLAALVPAIAIGCGVLTLLRTDGITGDAKPQLHWRWTPTSEQRLLAKASDEPAVPAPTPTAPAAPAPASASAPALAPAPAPAPAPTLDAPVASDRTK